MPNTALTQYYDGLFGGMLIGLSAALLMGLLGRIAGISGIVAGAMAGPPAERTGRLLFLAGLVLAPGMLRIAGYTVHFVDRQSPAALIVAAGLLVGFGTRLGNGCTSGHGVCGLARLSPRSLGATLAFLLTAMFTVYVMRHLLGDAR
jgi:uncharacterized protein